MLFPEIILNNTETMAIKSSTCIMPLALYAKNPIAQVIINTNATK